MIASSQLVSWLEEPEFDTREVADLLYAQFEAITKELSSRGRTRKQQASESAAGLAKVCRLYSLKEIIAVLIKQHGYDAVENVLLECKL